MEHYKYTQNLELALYQNHRKISLSVSPFSDSVPAVADFHCLWCRRRLRRYCYCGQTFGLHLGARASHTHARTIIVIVPPRQSVSAGPAESHSRSQSDNCGAAQPEESSANLSQCRRFVVVVVVVVGVVTHNNHIIIQDNTNLI